MRYNIPGEVVEIVSKLKSFGFEGFVVGGAVRDMIMNREPKDWDVATNAKPDEVQNIFEDSICENQFGTVMIKTEESGLVEVTTYRVESEYSDVRRPDRVEFVSTLEEDLSRRDFTINAIAMSPGKFDIIDPFGGAEDIKSGLIRAVGNPDERFREDALRLMRAVRFGAQLGFGIEQSTFEAIVNNHKLLSKISQERIRDEFLKILHSNNAGEGVRVLEKTGLLGEFLPELVEGVGVEQNHHHVFTVFEHNVRALEYAVEKNYSISVRLASLFHDIGKPRSKRGSGNGATFYNHETIGANMTDKLMKRMKFSNEIRNKVVLLVRWHQFYYQAEEVTASSVRRLVKNVGPENTDELLQVREADRIGSGVPKAVPYKLRHLKYMIEQVSTDPISPKMLAVNGDILKNELGLDQGIKLGLIIKSLLAEVLDDPSKNEKSFLIKRALELKDLSDKDLRESLSRIEKAQKEQEESIKRKYYVK